MEREGPRGRARERTTERWVGCCVLAARTVRVTHVWTPSFSSITFQFCAWVVRATPPVCATRAACGRQMSITEGEGTDGGVRVRRVRMC